MKRLLIFVLSFSLLVGTPLYATAQVVPNPGGGTSGESGDGTQNTIADETLQDAQDILQGRPRAKARRRERARTIRQLIRFIRANDRAICFDETQDAVETLLRRLRRRSRRLRYVTGRGFRNNRIVRKVRTNTRRTITRLLELLCSPNAAISPISDRDVFPDQVNEVSPAGSTVGITASATDVSGDDTVTYSLAVNPDGLFAIDASSGVITTTAPLDFETAESYQVTVQASSTDNTFSQQEFTITVLDEPNPVVDLAFPPQIGLFTGTNISFSGRVQDPEGQLVSLSADGGAGTQEVGLTSGSFTIDDLALDQSSDPITITLTATDVAGETTIIELVLSSPPLLNTVEDMSFSDTEQALFVADTGTDSIFRFDLMTASLTEFSSATVGNGPFSTSLFSIATDDAGGRLLATFEDSPNIFEISMSDGTRSVFHDQAMDPALPGGMPLGLSLDADGNRVLLNTIGGRIADINLTDSAVSDLAADVSLAGERIAADTANDLVYIADSMDSAITVSNISSGAGAPFSGGGATTGPDLAPITNLLFDGPRSRLLAGNDAAGALIAIDTTTGNRTFFSGGEEVAQLPAVAADSDRNVLYTVDPSSGIFYQINPDSGEMMALSEPLYPGEGPTLLSTTHVHFDSFAKRVLFTQNLNDTGLLGAVDLSSGNRSTVSSSTVGAGADASDYQAAANDPDTGIVYLTRSFDNGGNQTFIYSIDPATGDRTVISSPTMGTGTQIQRGEGLTLAPGGTSLLVVDNLSAALFSVDLATGNRTIVSDGHTGTGPSFTAPHSVIVNDVTNTAFVTDDQADTVFSVNLANGNRISLTDLPTASGATLMEISDLTMDTIQNRVLVTDRELGVFAINLVTGSREEISTDTRGDGVSFSRPEHITMSEDSTVVYVFDGVLSALFAVDIVSGDRVILSK